MKNITISFESINMLFPLHIVLDDKLHIVSTGSKLKRLYEDILEGELLEKYFIIHGTRSFCYTTICENTNQSYILQLRDSHIKLKGHFVKQESMCIFLCQLFVESEEYKPLSLKATGDFLLNIKSYEKKIDDFIELKKSLEEQAEVIKEKERALAEEKERSRIDKEKHSRSRKEIGFKIQKALLLGRLPKRDNLTIEVLNIPSQEVSGDFYDFFNHDTKCMDLVIGDVMGKGIAAALVAAALKGVLIRSASKRNLTTRGQVTPPQKIMKMVDEDITPELIALETFATLSYNRFDLFTHKLTSVDYGHTNILHYIFMTEEVNRIAGQNLPLGVQQQPQLEITIESFDDNDVFLFYSDGILEAQNNEGEMFGEERLIETLKKSSSKSSSEIVQTIKSDLMRFSEGEFKDDVTCIAVKIEETFSQTKIYNVMLITSRLDELKRVRNYITETASKISYFQEEKNLNDLLLAATEVVSNIIRHGYNNDPGNVIRIEVSVSYSWIRVCFVDKGIPFSMANKENVNDIQEITDESLKEMEGGFGLYIIHSLVDKVNYRRDSKGNNYLDLIKNFQKETSRISSSNLDEK
ncbi:SpoIIE family protein phosphatase [Candidatus Uabimicrobium sp. HlEnr_7]|uniref:SpoIIE family protein phosphatase n=1 Tax=Candidatus Uabimicrobium helgolandensis TaxID=3095367 RepID=UPI00355747AE